MSLKYWIAPVLLVCAASALHSAESVDVTIVTLEGEEKASKLQGISTASFVLGQGETAFKDVAEVRFGGIDTPPSDCTLVLRNGDLLKSLILSGDDAKLKIKSAALGELEIENNFINGITFSSKDGPPQETIDSFIKGTPPMPTMPPLAPRSALARPM